MNKIEVVIQPDCLSNVSESLRRAKIGPFRASDVTVFDPCATPDGSYRGASYAIGHERVKLELTVTEYDVEPAVDAIRKGIGARAKGEMDLVILPVAGSARGARSV
jgi:nitrogen regulatory protein PII